MVETINGLSRLSKQLNEKSNNLNSIITTVNKKLAKLNLGVESWLENPPIKADDYRDIWDDDGEHRIDRSRYATLLGYCKLGDEWELSVKEATLQTEISNYDGREYEEIVNPRKPEPLLQASRDIRIKAMRLLPTLLNQIEREAKYLLDSIKEADKAASKL